MTKSRAFPWKSCQNISSSVGITKSRAFAWKSCQNISSSVGMTKSRAFAWKYCQNIFSSVGMTKSRAFAWKSCQNCANLLCRNNISRPRIIGRYRVRIVEHGRYTHVWKKYLDQLRSPPTIYTSY